ADKNPGAADYEQAVHFKSEHVRDDLVGRGLGGNREDYRSHNVLDLYTLRLFDLESVRQGISARSMERAFFIVLGNRFEVVDLLAVVDDDVRAAQDADGPAGLVDDRGSTESLIGQEGDGLPNRGGRADRQRVRGHEIRGRVGTQPEWGGYFR